MRTLRDIIKKHPKWLDLPVGVAREDGEVDFIDGAGMVYKMKWNDDPNKDVDKAKDSYKILVFSTN